MKIFKNSVSILPLVTFRVLIGLAFFYGVASSAWKSEIVERFARPTFFFKYYGFEWVQLWNIESIYILYIILCISAIGISLGAFYRWSVAIFGLGFTYLHLLDSTNYINHYYLISLFCGWLFFAPAHAWGSLDARWGRVRTQHFAPLFWIRGLQLQTACVYFFAGIAKLNPDWLMNALPLRIWLLQSTDFPLLGQFFAYPATAYIFSWGGALYDLTIAGWLWWQPTRKYAYILVLIFHILTGLLFDIGLFPIIMPIATTLFFTGDEQHFIYNKLKLKISSFDNSQNQPNLQNNWAQAVFIGYFIVQIILPVRSFFMYDGNFLWTEEGYRWAWRVMLIEKEGEATFSIRSRDGQQIYTVSNEEFLTPFQIKRLIQHDHILQYAHYLADVYHRRYNIDNPIVTADIRVVLNGRRSRMLVDTTINLAAEPRDLRPKRWLLHYDN